MSLDVITQSYIGDGVYAEFYADGSMRLWTERASGTHEIYMEAEMLAFLTTMHARALDKLNNPIDT